jgi:hypothetical protein
MFPMQGCFSATLLGRFMNSEKRLVALGADPGTIQTSLSVFVDEAAIEQLLKRTEI